MKKSIPIGVVNFAELQMKNYYVVDKTLMIEEFLTRKSKVSLITRPRRFGKTSNMSMMSQFFDITKNSKALFENTKIAKTEHSGEMNKYPTIFLSFANCKGDYDSVKKMLFKSLRTEYAKYRTKFETDNYDKDIISATREQYQRILKVESLGDVNDAILILSEFLYEVYEKHVMILIDEYDTPFIEAQVGGYYDKIKSHISLLLQSALKDNDCLEYAMLTGIQRVSKESIFSHLNNVKVFNVHDEAYAHAFGFTSDETRTLLQYYDLQLNDEVKAMYNGYNMGGIDIYNPWSIINYADQKKLVSYWVNTSSNTMIKEAIAYCEDDFKDDYEFLIQHDYVETCVNLETSFYEIKQSENLWGLLVNAGYLTIQKEISLTNNVYRVAIPNHEVREEFKDLIAYHLKVQPRDLLLLYQGFKENNANKFLKAYSRLLIANSSYHDLKDENSYHMFLLGICLYMSDEYEIISNREAGTGRCDIILKAKISQLPSYIIEFKYTKTQMDLTKLAEKAVEQIVERKYDYDIQGEVIYVGLAHHGKTVEMKWNDRN